MSTEDFFRTRLATMIDLRHPLAVLSTRMPWKVIEGALAPVLAHNDRTGRTVEAPICSARPWRSPAPVSAPPDVLVYRCA